MTAIFISHWKAREPLWLNDRARKKFAIQVNGVFTSSLEGLWNGGLCCKETWDPSWLKGMVGAGWGIFLGNSSHFPSLVSYSGTEDTVEHCVFKSFIIL